MNNIKLLERKIDKAEVEAYKVKRKARRVLMSWKTKLIAVLLGVGFATLMMFVAFYNMSCWYDKNRVSFQQPIILRPAVLIEAREVQVASKGATMAVAVTTESNLPIINELYRKVRYMESTAGMNGKDPTATHNYCQSIGQVNEIGYLVDGNRKFCFADYGEQFLTFKRWFEKRLPDMTADEALCVWNTGTKQPQCLYSQKYNAL